VLLYLDKDDLTAQSSAANITEPEVTAVDVGGWLKSLGLEQYEAAFRENDVTAALLPNLTADDLKDLGITSVGHRRQLLDAITALRLKAVSDEAPVQISSSSAPADPSGPGDTSETTAERRPLSVMFCDLIGSTALSSRLDPEDLREVIRSYQARVVSTIQQFNGFIARYVGDGVLIYFGWPQAHETDAARAVRAGLAVAAAVSETQVGGEPLQVRIGIATGLVVIGEPIGSGDSRQQTAVGETPNVAARLQSLAGSGQVVIDAATRRQIGGLFECRELGTIALKGLPAGVPAWQVTSENRALGQFEALRSGITPLVGRDEEIELLLRRWMQAKGGSGKVMLISAEPGVGKSRLAEALAERIAAEPRIRLRYFCSPHHQDSALYPVIAQMERAAGFAHGDEAAAKLAKLQALLGSAGPSKEDVALIAELHGLPSVDLAPPLDLTPRHRKEKLFEALLRQLEGLARQQPVLMVFDDLHWIDPSSRELLDRLIERVADWPVLLLGLFRPEFQPPWVGQPQVTMLNLTRLDRQDTVAMVTNVAGNAALPPEIVAEIAERTDGVPLFVEEMTKTVLESGAQAPAALSAMPHWALSVPATLHASLMARLDRLGPTAREVAQAGAAIGREFGFGLLAPISDLPEPRLHEGLDRLTNAGLLFVRGAPPQSSYIFKHALVRDAAYSTLLRSRRRELHARIGRVLQEKFPDIAGAQPELLAHHLTQADLADQAIEWWRRAGRRSVARSAHAEATAHFECALDLLGRLPANQQRDARELDLILDLAVPLKAVHGSGALRVEQCALKAKDFSDKLHGVPTRFAARRLAWNCCLVRQPVPRAVALARGLIELADEDKNPAKLAVAHRALGYSLLLAGEVGEADKLLARGAALADAIPDQEFAVYGEHPSMLCRAYGGQAKITVGCLTSGAQLVEEAVAHARRSGNAHSLAWALGAAAHVFQISHEPSATARFASEAIEVAQEHHLPQWLGLGEQYLGWATHQLGDFDVGMKLLQQGVKRWNDTGAVMHTTHAEIMLAEIFLQQGQTASARVHLDAARAHQTSYGENYLASEIDRLEGFLQHHERNAIEAVEGCFSESLNTARRQGARLLELRTATTFARVLVARNERHRAVDLLALVYSAFTEGFDTVDVKDAKALLDELA
jgi:class 3 adenylate cyclase/predicted ATPase